MVLLQPRDLWPYPRHRKHRATSACSWMRNSTHPILIFPSWSKLSASASANWITAVFTPPKRVKSLQDMSKVRLPCAKHTFSVSIFVNLLSQMFTEKFDVSTNLTREFVQVSIWLNDISRSMFTSKVRYILTSLSPYKTHASPFTTPPRISSLSISHAGPR